MFKFLKRRKPEKTYWAPLGGDPIRVPPCPFGCDRSVLRDVIVGGEKRDIPLLPDRLCEHQGESLRRAAFDQQFELWLDPNTETWTAYPK
jgi:hypothetical protein